MLGYLIALAVVGLIAGAIARLLVPGPDPMGILGTMVLGIVGSLVGGLIVGLLFRPDGSDDVIAPVGWLGAIGGAVIALLIYRAMGGAGGRRPARLR